MPVDYSDVLARMDVQVIVIKRYDDNGGVYTACVTTWPNTEDSDGWSTMHVLGFLDDHEAFRAEMVASGFVAWEFADVDPEFRHYLTHNVLPIEWHTSMDNNDPKMAWRVQLYASPKASS